MINLVLLSILILLICISSDKALYKFGVPILLIFIAFGMLLGSDGIGGIYFDDYALTERICSIGLAFIMFYGGFGTNWRMAKPVAIKSVAMSTIGVAITGGLTGLFCYWIMKTTLLEGLLIGAIVASTDAASVFSILRSQKLNLKDELASLLELESGSNDPMSYMLTITILTFMSSGSGESIFSMLLLQVIFGLLIGFVLAKIAVVLLDRISFQIDGFYPIFVTAMALLTYSLSDSLGGNGYLSVYIAGIIIGNSAIPHKKSLVHFFDGISWIVQMGLFFLLGLLAFPSRLPAVMFTGVAISIFMILIARPIATFSILSWFKVPIKEQIFISWVGLRGAASIVFAIFAMNSGVLIDSDIFHIIFFIALFSVAVQGTLIPKVATKLNLVDDNAPVLKTFNDYREERATKLIEYNIKSDSIWANKKVMDARIPDEILIVMIKRGEEVIVPKGTIKIESGDTLVLSGSDYEMNKFIKDNSLNIN
ncbi:potassium/proton antiporter [Clostridium paraputrificum]|uniref:potassium/proton antiporter n=1 Tax=Clostridium TaxID=1485 RepID=UPI003D347DAD